MACTFVFRLQVAVIEGASWELVSADFLWRFECSWSVAVRRYARPERRVRHDCAVWWRTVGEPWPAARAPRRHPAPRLEHRPQLHSPHICTHTDSMFFTITKNQTITFKSADPTWAHQTPTDFKQSLHVHCLPTMSSNCSFFRKTDTLIFMKEELFFLVIKNKIHTRTSL